MDVASKIVHVIFRSLELISACIVTGILGYFFHRLHEAHAHANGRITYTMVVSCLSIAFSLALLPPLRYSFLAFPLDCCMWIMWLIAYALLENLSVGSSCTSGWYSYWGSIWWWQTPGVAYGSRACSDWRTVLAFSFVSMIWWLISMFIGIYVIATYEADGTERPANSSISHRRMPWSKKERIVSTNGHGEPAMTETV